MKMKIPDAGRDTHPASSAQHAQQAQNKKGKPPSSGIEQPHNAKKEALGPSANQSK